MIYYKIIESTDNKLTVIEAKIIELSNSVNNLGSFPADKCTLDFSDNRATLYIDGQSKPIFSFPSQLTIHINKNYTNEN